MMQMIKWRSPSNIALIKYWGKKGHQIPANPSLSFTLENAYTDMELSYGQKKDNKEEIDLEFLFEGKPNEPFSDKIKKYLSSIKKELPFLADLKIVLNSENSFPHSTGIASSASSMSALALCLCSLENQITNREKEKAAFFQRASYLARLGSGSAARSVYGGITTWGAIAGLEDSSDEYASPFGKNVHEKFKNYYDAVLIVSSNKKSTSSRQGHSLMDIHPYATKRYEQAHNNLTKLITVLETGDMDGFCQIVENEALSLHALMMSSMSGIILIKPETLELIQKIRTFREKTGLPVCFTLDAGPNVHLLYPAKYKNDIDQFVNEELIVYCERNYWIADKVGSGPVKIN